MTTAAHASAAQYRGRLAPSPTGYLHLGHALTFHAAWQRARDANGTLVMRMEDLDAERSRAVYADAALEDLRWLGIDWQEGPDVGGPFAPYAQSRRGDLYLAAWRRLFAGGFIYPCRCSRRDLASALSAPHEGDDPDDEPIYQGTCRPGTCRPAAPLLGATPEASLAAADSPGPMNWRFRVPDGEAIEFVDGNLGPQRFVAGADFGDFLVWRRDGAPVTSSLASPTTQPCRSPKWCAVQTCSNQRRAKFFSIARWAAQIPHGSTADW